MEHASPDLLTKSASAYEHLKRMAVRGELRPGRRLSPTDLASHFRISMTPVRAALARLASEGFIRVEENHGYFTKLSTVDEQRDLHQLLAIHFVASLQTLRPEQQASARSETAQLANADAAELAPSVAAERLEQVKVRLAEAAGNVATVEIVRNAGERTHQVRCAYFGDLALRIDVLAREGNIARSVLDGDLNGAIGLSRTLLETLTHRFPEAVADVNDASQKLRFP